MKHMKIEEILKEEIKMVTIDEIKLLENTPDEVGCGGLIFGGGSCGSKPDKLL